MDKIGNVPIRQGIEKVRPLAPALDQSLAAQDAQPLRDRRKLLADRRDDLRHAQLALAKQIEDPQTRGLAHGSKEPGRPLQGGRGGGSRL